MKSNLASMMNIVCVATALAMTAACAATGSDNVWQNSNYGSSSAAPASATPTGTIKPVSGLAILN